jgi:ATP-dependent Clp protease ATP-binding subunit ClpA
MQEPTDSKISESLKEQVRRHLPKSDFVSEVCGKLTTIGRLQMRSFAIGKALALESELNSRIAGQAEARRNFVEGI